MGYIIIFFIILIYSSMLSIILKKRIEEVLPISIVEIVLIIFLCGLFDQLKLGITIIEVLAILQVAIISAIIIKKKKEIIWNILTPGLLIYTLLFFVNIIINRNRIFEDYDEFNHWAVIIKNMFLYNTYGTNEQGIVTFNEYPPFTANFQYLFLVIQKVYREDIIIIAQNVLYFSIIIPITKTIKWDKNLTKLIALLPIIILLPLVFYENFYLEILVDGIIGIMFAYVMFSSFEKQEDIKFKYLKILAGLIMLVLTKTSSMALAVLAIIIILIEKIIFGLKEDKEKAKKEIKILLLIVLIMISIIAIWYFKVDGTQKRWDFQQIVMPNSYKIENIKQISISFVRSILFNEKITPRQLTVLSATLLIICLQFYTLKKIKIKELKYYEIAMSISIVIWIVGMLWMYITIFDLDESQFLTCFERYISTMLLANVTFQILLIAQLEEKNWKKQLIIMISILFSFMSFSNINEKYIYGNQYIIMSKNNRYIYTEIRDYKNKLKPTDKILYITGSSKDLDYLTSMVNYEIMPIRLEKSIRPGFVDIEHFKNAVKDYNYVFIYQIENKDKEKIQDAFENKDIETSALYSVVNENNDIILKLERKKYER